jgi:hypothetical protein
MQLSGKLIQVLPLLTGTGKNGTWLKQEIIIQTSDEYPKKVCIAIWGDKIKNEILNVGNELTIDFEVESREFNGRWYTDVKAWKMELVNSGATNQNVHASEEVASDEVADDLPF